MSDQTKIQIDLTPAQAEAVRDALDVYTRLCLGQLEEIANLVRGGIISGRGNAGDQLSAVEACEAVELLLRQAKDVLGHPRNGSYGIGNPNVHLSGRRAYEVKKTLAKVIAVLRDPSPEFRGVDYDGLGPRYTSDPAPQARLL